MELSSLQNLKYKSEEVCSIDRMPMKEPFRWDKGVKNLDQSNFLNLVKRSHKLCHDEWLIVMKKIIENHGMKVVKANIPTKGTYYFIDLVNAQVELDRYLEYMSSKDKDVSRRQFVQSIEVDWKKHKNSKLTQHLKQSMNLTYWRDVLYHRMTKSPCMLRWLEQRLDGSIESYFRLSRRSVFRPNAIQYEIMTLLKVLDNKKPKSILEIGTGKGGVFYLFSKVAHKSAKLATVDVHNHSRKLFSSFERSQQKHLILEGDSSSFETINKIKHYFPQGIDFLFIDGDHAYEGVKKDFENFMPLVNSGGMVAFDDIVEDHHTRYGVMSGGWAGDAPKYWNEIKNNYSFEEIIHKPLQSGHGIGLIYL
jgi:predicted O-methyltransferase YrrM